MPEVDTPHTSLILKRAVKDSCKIKWQNRWEASQRGRQMFEFHPSVLGLFGGILNLYSNFKRNFFNQTVENLVRRRVLRRLIWYCTVADVQ